MEIHGVPWTLNGTPWSSMDHRWKPHGVPWNSMGFHGPSMELHGVPWIIHGNPMVVHGVPWNSMDFHGLPWNSMELHGLPWNSMDFHGIPWTSMGLFYTGRLKSLSLFIQEPVASMELEAVHFTSNIYILEYKYLNYSYMISETIKYVKVCFRKTKQEHPNVHDVILKSALVYQYLYLNNLMK